MNQANIFDLLAASAPYTPDTEPLMLYGQFVGTWDVEKVYYKNGEKSKKVKGVWVFNWILGGRGVQDVLYTIGDRPHQYGTTLRCYDSLRDAWHISWMQPESGEFVNLTGRKISSRIEQEGSGADYARRERWSFTDITPDTFLWVGEVSFDNGASWLLEEEISAIRRK